MSRYSISLPPRVIAGLRRESAAAVPAECCGALIGDRTDDAIAVRTLIPVTNLAHDVSSYLIDATTVRRLERHAECASQHVVGFYHSHPRTTAEPSSRDVEVAWPGYVYLIVDPRTGDVRCWMLRDDRTGFTELRVAMLAGAA